MYLKITNPGICYPEAFTVLGVSTARGQDGKIGQFGSGAKMGINTCLRFGINPVIVSGDMMVQFDCIQKSMGEKRFDQVVAIINDEKKELGFATEFGAIDWTKIDYAIREFVSNARDQGGCELSVVNDIEKCSPNSTSVYVEYSKEVQTYHKNIKKYFLDGVQLSDKDPTVIDNDSGVFMVYRKGVLVSETDQKSLFTYNINNLKVDESRNADSWMVSYYCGNALKFCSQDQADRLLNALIGNNDYVEVRSFEVSYFDNNVLRGKIRDSFNRLYKGWRITTSDLAGFCKNKNAVLVLSDRSYKILMTLGVPIAEVEGGRIGAENGFMPIDTTTDCKRIFNRVWNKIVKLGMHNGKDKPVLAMFAKPMSNGSSIGGYQDGNTVYIERNHVNPKVILEEIGHYVTDANDCTRDFQDWAFNVAGGLL